MENMIGKKVIVRGDRSGVFFGTLAEKDGREVKLEKCRRLWYWDGQQFQLGTVYPAKDFYVWHNKLTGSCEMGRKAFAKDHDIDIGNDSMTVEEFINLTKDSFGGSIIRQIAEELKISLGVSGNEN